MARTVVQICGVSGERRYFGFEQEGNALGDTDSVSKGASLDTDWCNVHNGHHASTEVVVEVPFEGPDFKDERGKLDPNWSQRFNAKASARADQVLFEAR